MIQRTILPKSEVSKVEDYFIPHNTIKKTHARNNRMKILFEMLISILLRVTMLFPVLPAVEQ